MTKLHLLVAAAILLPSLNAAAESLEFRDDGGGTWKGEVTYEKKSGGECTARIKVKHGYEKKIKRAELKLNFKGRTEERTIGGMLPKDRWEQWTFTGKKEYCELKDIDMKRPELS